MSYLLINPNIESSAIKSNKKITDDAAIDLWHKFSSKSINYTPEFYFTFLDEGSNKIYHYKVNETLENNKVKYNLEKYKNNKINEKEIIKKYNKENNEQNGGKKHRKRYKDDSSSSSDDYMVNYKKPISNLSSYPIYYNPNIYGVNNISIPSFGSRYNMVIESDGLPTIYASTLNGIATYKLISNKWTLTSSK